MNKYLKNLEKLSAKIALKSAKFASGNASLWGFFQPEEPLNLRIYQSDEIQKFDK